MRGERGDQVLQALVAPSSLPGSPLLCLHHRVLEAPGEGRQPAPGAFPEFQPHTVSLDESSLGKPSTEPAAGSP